MECPKGPERCLPDHSCSARLLVLCSLGLKVRDSAPTLPRMSELVLASLSKCPGRKERDGARRSDGCLAELFRLADPVERNVWMFGAE